jgi:tRNA pseudouridine38-40 synthase
VYQKLNIEMMQKCAEQIIGTHNFRSFCKVETDIHNHNCMVSKSQWDQKDTVLVYEIASNRFLHGMVRALVGTMVDVGRGHTDIGDFVKILETKDRTSAGMSAPAKGLFLEEIIY